MQREALIGLTIMLTLIALGASPGTDPVAHNLSEPAAHPVTHERGLADKDQVASEDAARLEITGIGDEERIILTMQLDVAI